MDVTLELKIVEERIADCILRNSNTYILFLLIIIVTKTTFSDLQSKMTNVSNYIQIIPPFLVNFKQLCQKPLRNLQKAALQEKISTFLKNLQILKSQ